VSNVPERIGQYLVSDRRRRILRVYTMVVTAPAMDVADRSIVAESQVPGGIRSYAENEVALSYECRSRALVWCGDAVQ